LLALTPYDGTIIKEFVTELFEPKFTKLRTVTVEVVVITSMRGWIGNVIGEIVV
jgi:hypothetical protein